MEHQITYVVDKKAFCTAMEIAKCMKFFKIRQQEISQMSGIVILKKPLRKCQITPD